MMMKKLSPVLASVTLAMGVSAASATTYDIDKQTTEILDLNPGTLVVASNGVKYTKTLSTGTVRIKRRFSYDTGQNGRIKSWEFWPSVQYQMHQSVYLSGTRAFAEKKSYPKGDRPSSVATTLFLDVPVSFLAEAAVSACNGMAAKLRGMGRSNAEIFSKDRGTHMRVTPELKVELTGFKSTVVEEVPGAKNLIVTCSEFTGPAHPQIGTVRPSDPAVPWLQAPDSTKPDPVPDTRRPKRLLKIGG